MKFYTVIENLLTIIGYNMNSQKKSKMFNFRINLPLWEKLTELVEEKGYFSIASFLREAIIEKLKKEAKNG